MTWRKHAGVFLTWKKEKTDENVAQCVSFLTLMLLVQRVGLPEPHQTAEEQQRPEDLHKETHLDEEEFSPTQTFLPKQEAYGCLLTTLSWRASLNTFCLLRRVQFFHSKRRIWEPVFMAPRLHPWGGSWDCEEPAERPGSLVDTCDRPFVLVQISHVTTEGVQQQRGRLCLY